MWSQESQQAFQLLPPLLTKLWQKAFFNIWLHSTSLINCLGCSRHNFPRIYTTLRQRALCHSTHTFVVPGGGGPWLAISFLCWNISCCYWLGYYESTRHQTLIEPINQSEAEFLTDLLPWLPTTPTLFGFEAPTGKNQKHASICLKLCLNIASLIQYLMPASRFTIFSSHFKITDKNSK